MGQIIAGVYQIEQRIGSGGGGIVYLGTHLRLNKRVVLKADKRSLNTKPEILRREVDMLKGLSHTYIPQVYDFIQEDGIVYTVMDYIEGESLDHVLERGQTPPQSQLIQWACQLLEALAYLHSRPPHGILHADIKPANIMLRTNGDICLIDYNIALALGEDGAIKVGYSRGYASPEHYGSDGGVGTELSENQGKKLDVRSDIYSLGATLYHLISGEKPAQRAEDVKPLKAEVCSPSVSAIIQKAMAPEPDNRYQSAEEMLAAFRQLPIKDRRMVLHRRRIRCTVTVLTMLFLLGGGSTFVGLKQMEQRQTALKLAEYSEDERSQGNIDKAVELALQAIPKEDKMWNAPVAAQAQKALTDALGVYDLSDTYTDLGTVELPSVPFDLILSDDGQQFAAVCEENLVVFDAGTMTKRAELPVVDSALAEAVFTDPDRILYAGPSGITLYDLNKQTTVWTGKAATEIALSGDRSIAAAVNRDEEKAVIYRVADGQVLKECSFEGKHRATAYNDIFANPHNSVFALNEDGSMLAVSFSNGALTIFDLRSAEDNLYMYNESAYTGFSGGFSGKYFAFAAGKSDQSVFGLIDTAEGTYAGELQSRSQMRVKANSEGIWLSEGNLLVCFDPETLEDTETSFTDQSNIVDFSISDRYVLTVTDDSAFSFFDNSAKRILQKTTERTEDFSLLSDQYAVLANRSEPEVRILKNRNHRENTAVTYDPLCRHDEARVTPDLEQVMLFDYESFSIYSKDGTLIQKEMLPDSEKIYDQQFHREQDKSWLEVIWYDGTVRCYDAKDGTLISEEMGKKPSKTLKETFETDKYQFVSELHGTPQVYDRKTEKLVGELEKDSYLTYVTEWNGMILTEYVDADGRRYGLILNQDLETLAYLPDLCDMEDGTFFFDYGNGELRQCRFYSLQDLMELGEQYIEKRKGDE